MAESAVDATAFGHDDCVDDALSTLASLPGHAASGGTVAGWVLSGRLDLALRSVWAGGWQPLAVVRSADKRLGGRHAGLAVTAIASEARSCTGPGVAVPEQLRVQLRQVDAVVWWDASKRNYVDHWAERELLQPAAATRTAVALLRMLAHLPVLPSLMPPPAQWGRSAAGRHSAVASATATATTVDGRVLAKVRALLAKAESTTFDDEADALTAKAQELMARHRPGHAVPERSRRALPPAVGSGSTIPTPGPRPSCCRSWPRPTDVERSGTAATASPPCSGSPSTST